MRLKGKTALITGGANGIGLATTERFAKEGAKIIMWDLSDKGKEVAERLEKEGSEVLFQNVSVTNKEEVVNAVAKAHGHFGRIDILINNAGITKDRTLLKMSDEEWDDVIAVNLTGVFNCTRAVAPIMKEQNYGRIISASSNVAIRGNYGQTNYVATKSAIIGVTKVWAMELGRYGITVNCISPGYVWTPLVERQIPDTMKTRGLTREQVMNDVLLAAQPTKRFVTPEEVGALALFLCREEARSITGANLNVDGGWTAA